MILLREYEHDPWLAAKRLAPARRHIVELGVFAVPLEGAGNSWLHVGPRTALLRGRCRWLLSCLEQRDVEFHVEGARNHCVGLSGLDCFAGGATVRHLEFRCRAAPTVTTHRRAACACAPVLQFARFLEDQLE